MRCASTASTSTARPRRGKQLENAAAYLELHIEQGPVLESTGPAARRRARHLRRRAAPDHLARPGRARRLDADGPAPRRARRRREAGARDPRDRRAGRRRRRVHDRRRRHASRGSSPPSSRPPSSCSTCATSTRRKLAAMCEQAREACERFAREEQHRGRVGADLGDPADPLRRDAGRLRGRGGARGRGRRRTGCRAARCTTPPRSRAAGIPTVMLFVQSLRGLIHTKLEDTKPEHLELVGAGARPAGGEDDRLGRATLKPGTIPETRRLSSRTRTVFSALESSP